MILTSWKLDDAAVAATIAKLNSLDRRIGGNVIKRAGRAAGKLWVDEARKNARALGYGTLARAIRSSVDLGRAARGSKARTNALLVRVSWNKTGSKNVRYGHILEKGRGESVAKRSWKVVRVGNTRTVVSKTPTLIFRVGNRVVRTRRVAAVAATPFLKPAFESKRAAVVDTFASVLRSEIERIGKPGGVGGPKKGAAK